MDGDASPCESRREVLAEESPDLALFGILQR